MDNRPKYSFLEAKQKIEHWCAYQERCAHEVLLKFGEWKIDHEHASILLSDLISNNFVNEERFAESFASGKFRIKKWGRIKIKQHLKQKRISDYSLNKALGSIDHDQYWLTLVDLMQRKWSETKSKSVFEKKAKVFRFLQSRGFESDLISDALKQVLDQ